MILLQNAPKPYVTISNAPYDGIIGCFTPNQVLAQLEQERLAREENERRLREEQERVNQSTTPKEPKLNDISKERLLQEVIKTLNGDYGDGREIRERNIGLGHEIYEEIQRQVNLNEKYGTTNDDNIRLY